MLAAYTYLFIEIFLHALWDLLRSIYASDKSGKAFFLSLLFTRSTLVRINLRMCVLQEIIEPTTSGSRGNLVAHLPIYLIGDLILHSSSFEPIAKLQILVEDADYHLCK